MSFEQFDQANPLSLRRTRSLKWNAYPDALGAFVAESDLGTAPPVSAALHEAVDHLSLGYISKPISAPVREATAAWQSTYGWDITPAQVSIVSDVVSALIALLERFVESGLPVVLPIPNYMPFLTMPQQTDRELILVNSHCVDGNWSLDLAAIEAALAPRGGLLILTNPWNPVGRALSVEELRGLAAVVEQTGALVFSDEIHAPLVFEGNRHVPYANLSAATAAHTITAVSASKAWNTAGLKCAQLIFTNPQHAARWRAFEGLLSQPSTLGMYATVAAYQHGGSWLRDFMTYVDVNRQLLARTLHASLPIACHQPPQATYLAWVDLTHVSGIGPEMLENPARYLLKNAGVAVTDGALCGRPGAFRLNLATPHHIFAQIIERLSVLTNSS